MVRSPERYPWSVPHPFPSTGFFLASPHFRTAGRRIADRGQREARWTAGAFARPNAAPPRLHGLASPIRALSRAGFAIMCRGLISGGLFSHFSDGFPQAIIYKGTMGPWEQTIPNRQKAAAPEGARLFPSYRADLGTWEQKWPIPMQENPRACGYPLPPPAGKRD